MKELLIELTRREVKFSSDTIGEEPGTKSRRYYIKDEHAYYLFHHNLTSPGYHSVIKTIDGDLAERWLKGEIIIMVYRDGND